MEDVDGIFFISEIYVPTIEKKGKEANEYHKHRMGYSRQKGTWNNTVLPRDICSI